MERTDSARLRCRSFSDSDSQTNNSRIERTSVYICPIPWNYTRQKVANVFSIFGETNGATILTKTRGRRNPDGCVGFVDFKRNSSARRAIEEYNGVKMRTVFSSCRGESRLNVRFAENSHARTVRPARARIGRPRRRAARVDLSPRRIGRRRSPFSSRSRSRSRRRRASRELSISNNKMVKEESPSPSETSKSYRSRENSTYRELSKTKSKNRNRFSSEESTKFSDSKINKTSQRPKSAKSIKGPIVSRKSGENIVVCYNQNERKVLINPTSKSPEKEDMDYNSVSSPKPKSMSDEYSSLHKEKISKVGPTDNKNYDIPIRSSPEAIVQYSRPHTIQPKLEEDMEFEQGMIESRSNTNRTRSRDISQYALSPKRGVKLEPASVFLTIDQNADEDLGMSPMNEVEKKKFEKFKNQRTRIRWQTYQQFQGHIKLLRTKNLGMEEDLIQLEDQCRYWKDKFKDTLQQYSATKDELREERRISFEELTAIT